MKLAAGWVTVLVLALLLFWILVSLPGEPATGPLLPGNTYR